MAEPADPSAAKKMLWEDRFAGAALSTNWTRALSQASGTSLRLVGGELTIAAPANAAAFIEHPLPAVRCAQLPDGLRAPIRGLLGAGHGVGLA